MAKSGRELIKLESSEKTGVFYVTTKNRRTRRPEIEKKVRSQASKARTLRRKEDEVTAFRRPLAS